MCNVDSSGSCSMAHSFFFFLQLPNNNEMSAHVYIVHVHGFNRLLMLWNAIIDSLLLNLSDFVLNICIKESNTKTTSVPLNLFFFSLSYSFQCNPSCVNIIIFKTFNVKITPGTRNILNATMTRFHGIFVWFTFW